VPKIPLPTDPRLRPSRYRLATLKQGVELLHPTTWLDVSAGDVPRFIDIFGDKLWWSWTPDFPTAHPWPWEIKRAPLSDAVWDVREQAHADSYERSFNYAKYLGLPPRGEPDTVRPLPIDPEGALEKFRAITGPADVLAFARRWGPLGLCKHRLPYTHNPPPLVRRRKQRHAWCRPLGFELGDTWEYLDDWYRWVDLANAIQSIQIDPSKVGSGHPAEADAAARGAAWRTIAAVDSSIAEHERGYGSEEFSLKDDDFSVQMDMLARHVQGWLVLADARPLISWGNESMPLYLLEGVQQPTFSLTTPDRSCGVAFLLLAVQLMNSLGIRVYRCAGCQRIFRPDRKLPSNKRHWCNNCVRVANRTYVAKSRREERERKEREHE